LEKGKGGGSGNNQYGDTRNPVADTISKERVETEGGIIAAGGVA